MHNLESGRIIAEFNSKIGNANLPERDAVKESSNMLFLKFILAMLPIIWLIIALAVLKMPGYRACPIALIVGIIASMMIWPSIWLPLVSKAF